MEELSRYFPAGMKVIYPYDTTPFVKVAINEVVWTLFEAIFLVFLVMYLFLGNLRATLMPTLAVPVVILGPSRSWEFGFSINMLTMFAMVLAIGLLVDDAIVVVENVERVMSEEGLPAQRGHPQVHGGNHQRPDRHRPGAGRGVRPHGVFRRLHRGHLPPVFRDRHRGHAAVGGGGPDPDPGALRLAPQAGGERARGGGDRLFPVRRPFFRWFDRAFLWTRDRYQALVGRILAKKLRYLVIYLLIVVALVFLFQRMPTAYLPDEDQGIMFVQAMLPAGSTLEQTQKVQDQVRRHFLEDEKEAVASMLHGRRPELFRRRAERRHGLCKLKDWDLRPGAT
jgi:multidrug efflux pump subunit AcrB